MTAGLRNQTEHNPAYSAAVIAAYGVVPKPRHSAEAPWNAHKGGFPKPRGWRQRSSWYRRGGPGVQSSEVGGEQTFAGAPVTADIAPEPKAKPEIKVAWMHGRKPIIGHEARTAAVIEPAAAAPEPAPVVVAPEPEPIPEPVAPAPVALACTCEADAPLPAIVDAAAVAAYLRELAGKYGPRRAHKLSAMAEFVTAAAGSR